MATFERRVTSDAWMGDGARGSGLMPLDHRRSSPSPLSHWTQGGPDASLSDCVFRFYFSQVANARTLHFFQTDPCRGALPHGSPRRLRAVRGGDFHTTKTAPEGAE